MSEEELEEYKLRQSQLKSPVSLWDVFPAFWYNIGDISNVIRLYLASTPDVQKEIVDIWSYSQSNEPDQRIVWRVAHVNFFFSYLLFILNL